MDVPNMPKTTAQVPKSTAFRYLADILDKFEFAGSRFNFSGTQLVLASGKDGSMSMLKGTITVRPGRLMSEMSAEPVAEVEIKPAALSNSSGWDELSIRPAKLARWEYVEPLLDVMRRVFPQAG